MPTIILILLTSITCLAQSIDVRGFVKPEENPVIRADSSYRFIDPVSSRSIAWQRADVFNPAAIVKDNKIFVLFRAEDNPKAGIGGRTSRIGLAESIDGIHFSKHPEPVLYPDNDSFAEFDHPGGCEDPRIAQTEDGKYVLAYTAWNKRTPRLSIAFSNDLIHWEKKGPAFSGDLRNRASKSGSMITKFVGGKQVLARINGRYWMYWGEHLINLAWSEDLYHWNPSVDAHGELIAIMRPRPGKFDSNLTECGPPAIITDEGIDLFYNGRNATDNSRNNALPAGTYSVGHVVFDVHDPSRILSRSDEPFLRPTLPFEITGQYKAGTVFSEALVLFQDKWFLYYGTADSFVGVAVAPLSGK